MIKIVFDKYGVVMKMIILSLLIGVLILCVCATCDASDQIGRSNPEVLQLWPGEAPVGDGSSEKSDARITIYHPEKPNGTAVVICPGGGYGGLCVEPEGYGIAKWLNNHGITGVVLEYRLPAGRYMVPLLDAQRAIRITRANAKAWKLNAKHIGIIGFSAGGHLASTAGTHFDAGDLKSKDKTTRQSCRPDFMILIYPVITMGAKAEGGTKHNLLGDNPTSEMMELFSNEMQTTIHTPPAFLAHALDDTVVSPDNSRNFYLALRAHKVPSEYLELPNGGHGLNGYAGPSWDAWQTRSLEWLKEMKLSK